jgi:hypothetical protein
VSGNTPHDPITSAFNRELSQSPTPPGLRARAIHEATAAPQRNGASRAPQLLAMVATLLAIAVVATLVVGSHVMQRRPIPVGSTVPPSAREGAGVAFDEARGVLVVFGGNGNPTLNDTWTWDGRYWTQQHPATSPSPRHDAAMAYDAAHRTVVLFGGTTPSDTWNWNGSNWQQKHPAHVPGLDGGTMAYDPITRTVLLFGLRQNSGSSTAFEPQTWSWNGSDWIQLSPSATPTEMGTMLNDGDHILLLAPSFGMIGGRYLTQTWTWTGSTWEALAPQVNLPLLGFASGAYNPQLHQLVVVTGDTWTWNGLSWSRQHPTLQPLTIGYMAYVPSLHEVVSWGDRSSSVDNEMFGWSGTDWKLIDAGTAQASLNNGGKGFQGVMTPDQAAAAVRATVKSTQPVLLPTALPGGPYDATVNASADGFDIEYRSDLRDKTISFGIVVANPPPGTATSSDTRVPFRSGAAEYFVYDPSAPQSSRWLMWSEGGSPKTGGVPYFLSTTGLTDQEFWQVANSLR